MIGMMACEWCFLLAILAGVLTTDGGSGCRTGDLWPAPVSPSHSAVTSMIPAGHLYLLSLTQFVGDASGHGIGQVIAGEPLRLRGGAGAARKRGTGSKGKGKSNAAKLAVPTPQSSSDADGNWARKRPRAEVEGKGWEGNEEDGLNDEIGAIAQQFEDELGDNIGGLAAAAGVSGASSAKTRRSGGGGGEEPGVKQALKDIDERLRESGKTEEELAMVRVLPLHP